MQQFSDLAITPLVLSALKKLNLIKNPTNKLKNKFFNTIGAKWQRFIRYCSNWYG